MSSTGVNHLRQKRENLDELFRKAERGDIDKGTLFKHKEGEFDSFTNSSNSLGISGISPSFAPTDNSPVREVVYANDTELFKLFECKSCKKNVIDTVFECGHCACAVCCYNFSKNVGSTSAGFCFKCNIEIKNPRKLINDGPEDYFNKK